MKIERQETAILIAITLFAIIWIIYITPTLSENTWWQQQLPPTQYLLYNLGFMLLTIILFGGAISIATKKEFNFKKALKTGTATWISFSFILDLLQPPFAYNIAGKLLTTETASLSGASIDRMLGWIYTNTFPALQNTFWIYFLVYVFTPIAMAFLVALLLAPKQFIAFITQK